MPFTIGIGLGVPIQGSSAVGAAVGTSVRYFDSATAMKFDDTTTMRFDT